MNDKFQPAILSIAGSDPSGGAGIQGDLKTIQRLGGLGQAVLAGLTAQSTLGVFATIGVEPSFVIQQLDALWQDRPPLAAKTGMLATERIVTAVAEFLEGHPLPLVVDPVMVSTSGARLLDEDAIEAVRTRLIPLANLVTPNVPEAQVLVKRPIRSLEEAVEAAEEILGWGSGGVLIKGGDVDYGQPERVSDVFLERGQAGVVHHYPRACAGPHTSFHGSGCCLAAAAATGLGFGLSLSMAVEAARKAVQEAIAGAKPIGQGAIPVNHGCIHLLSLGGFLIGK
jgi:hydroxymethylpyrimidine kinase/phosphomethylpyrimidine kinase